MSLDAAALARLRYDLNMAAGEQEWLRARQAELDAAFDLAERGLALKLREGIGDETDGDYERWHIGEGMQLGAYKERAAIVAFGRSQYETKAVHGFLDRIERGAHGEGEK